jgi:phenylpyruvate tautomerase PptA (4-oxalocrotonate tautomerase family)
MQSYSASYVIVRELAATDWGYGGFTQAQRRQQLALVADVAAA